MKNKKSTQAEEILTSFIKGDIRDYDKSERTYFSVSLDVALKAIQKALRVAKTKQSKNPKKVYILKSDTDGTMTSTDEPIGVVTANEKVAKKYVAESNFGYRQSYEEAIVVDTYEKVMAMNRYSINAEKRKQKKL